MAEEIRIVKGTPTDEELAAVVSVLRALPARGSQTPMPVSRWARSSRPGATPLSAGPAAWRASALPR